MGLKVMNTVVSLHGSEVLWSTPTAPDSSVSSTHKILLS